MKLKKILQRIRRTAREKAGHIDLSRNNLTSLPPEIGQLTHLTHLDLSRNNLTSLPPEIGRLTHLTHLDLSRNDFFSSDRLATLPQLTHLTRISLSDNNLTSLPPEIGQLTHLFHLDISRNNLTSLPPEIGQLTHLNHLDISRNNLTNLPPEIGQLTHLCHLYIGDNGLIDLPPNIVQLKELYTIHFSSINEPLVEKIAFYKNKWSNLALYPQLGDRALAIEAIKTVYKWMEIKEPEVIFFESPYQAFSKINGQVEVKLRNQFNSPLNWIDFIGLDYSALREIYSPTLLENAIPRSQNQLNNLIYHQLRIQLNHNLEINKVGPEVWADRASWFDFCVSLGSNCQEKRDLYGALVKNCGWIFPFKEVCLVCDRPCIIRFDNQQNLHAEGEPAIQFSDGFSVYAYHGRRLPEKYGKLHPAQWQSNWLLSEDNAELRRVLIQGIGYDRLCQELQATELDSWQEYSLLRIDNPVDIEPIYLLKMNCLSTNYIHVLRVPPDIESAREAIRWINWGIDPGEFLIES